MKSILIVKAIEIRLDLELRKNSLGHLVRVDMNRGDGTGFNMVTTSFLAYSFGSLNFSSKCCFHVYKFLKT